MKNTLYLKIFIALYLLVAAFVYSGLKHNNDKFISMVKGNREIVLSEMSKLDVKYLNGDIDQIGFEKNYSSFELAAESNRIYLEEEEPLIEYFLWSLFIRFLKTQFYFHNYTLLVA